MRNVCMFIRFYYSILFWLEFVKCLSFWIFCLQLLLFTFKVCKEKKNKDIIGKSIGLTNLY